MATNGRQLRYLSTSNEESAKLFMVIDLLLQESVVVIIDFVDILRSNISTERMVHGYGQQLDDRGGNVWFVVDTASYGRLYRYNRIYIHSIPVFHTLQPCGQADGYWIKLSTVVPGSRLKVKKKERRRASGSLFTPSTSTSISHSAFSSSPLQPQTCHARENSPNINTLLDSHTSLKNPLSSKTLVNPKFPHPLPLPLLEVGGNLCQNVPTKASGRPAAGMKQGSERMTTRMMNGEMSSEEEGKKDPRWLF